MLDNFYYKKTAGTYDFLSGSEVEFYAQVNILR